MSNNTNTNTGTATDPNFPSNAELHELFMMEVARLGMKMDEDLGHLVLTKEDEELLIESLRDFLKEAYRRHTAAEEIRQLQQTEEQRRAEFAKEHYSEVMDRKYERLRLRDIDAYNLSKEALRRMLIKDMELSADEMIRIIEHLKELEKKCEKVNKGE